MTFEDVRLAYRVAFILQFDRFIGPVYNDAI
jgi:hypothetical protein